MSEVKKEQLDLMYETARSAKASNDAITAKKYYDMILAEDPVYWEPIFYSVYFSYATMKNGEIGNKATEIKNCLNTVLLMVNKISDKEEKNYILIELKNSISKIATLLHSSSINFYNSLPGLTKNPLDKCARTVLIGDLLLTMGEALQNNQMSSHAIEIYKQAIDTIESEVFFSAGYKDTNIPAQLASHHNRIVHAANFIRTNEPAYKTKREIALQKTTISTKKGGCYVATCVYGSYDCPEVWTLRRYRDNTLSTTWYGRAFIRAYYAISPTIVKLFGETSWFKKIWKYRLDRMVKKLKENGVENTPYEDQNW